MAMWGNGKMELQDAVKLVRVYSVDALDWVSSDIQVVGLNKMSEAIATILNAVVKGELK